MYDYAGIDVIKTTHSINFSRFEKEKKSKNSFIKTLFTTGPLHFSNFLLNPKEFVKEIYFAYHWIRLLLHCYLLLPFLNDLESLSFKDYLFQYFPNDVIEHAFMPLTASVCSCSVKKMEDYPVSFVFEFLEKTAKPFTKDWSQVKNGVRDVCNKLSSNVDSIRTSTGVKGIYKQSSKLIVETQSGSKESFDHVHSCLFLGYFCFSAFKLH